MELLLSNYKPAKITSKSSQDFFSTNLKTADKVKIASGYISAEALVELKRTIEINNDRPKLDLIIGMHYFEKFTKPQYNAMKELSSFLKERNIGNIKIATIYPFHGKMYSFEKDGSDYAALVGSSNLSSIFNSFDRLYEADAYLSNPSDIQQISTAIDTLSQQICEDVDTLSITEFKEVNHLLENHYNVKKVSKSELNKLWKQKGIYQFSIPIKSTPKSNLNVFFGKGRENKNNGFILPRPWYEVELIVPQSITKQDGYPRLKSFEVITDDGWSFRCKTSGDYSKNFRSEDDLLVLGKWIKGRMEQSGALKVGELVKDNNLDTYGRNTLSMYSTNDENIWLLDFSV